MSMDAIILDALEKATSQNNADALVDSLREKAIATPARSVPNPDTIGTVSINGWEHTLMGVGTMVVLGREVILDGQKIEVDYSAMQDEIQIKVLDGELRHLITTNDVSANNISGNATIRGDGSIGSVHGNASVGGDMNGTSVGGNLSVGGDASVSSVGGNMVAGGNLTVRK
jgi:hypothetical protein